MTTNDPLEPEVSFVGFELGECVLNLNPRQTKYLRAVHRTALELAIPNRFGVEAGGFWLTTDQIAELRRLPDHYPPNEARSVAEIIELYLIAQCDLFQIASPDDRLMALRADARKDSAFSLRDFI